MARAAGPVNSLRAAVGVARVGLCCAVAAG
jgi:hypothetical protein